MVAYVSIFALLEQSSPFQPIFADINNAEVSRHLVDFALMDIAAVLRYSDVLLGSRPVMAFPAECFAMPSSPLLPSG